MVAKQPVKPKPIPKYLIFIALCILIVTILFHQAAYEDYNHLLPDEHSKRPFSKPVDVPKWYEIIDKNFKNKRHKIGVVNMDGALKLEGIDEKAAEVVDVKFQSVSGDTKWKDLFPEWIDEDKPEEQSCLEITMPRFDDYQGLNVVVATAPCMGEAKKREYMDIFRLQVNLVVANLLVRSSSMKYDIDGEVYAVFLGSCGPMIEIFRCDDLFWHEGNSWIYKPDLRRLKQKVLMPVGTCQLARPFAELGQERWKRYALQSTFHQPKEAYVTVIHSSEAYVCGAIVLAQSIIHSKSTKDLILLADNSLSQKSLLGLKLAGWKIKHIKRIKSPNAEKNAYNEWNYSKLRIWQLTEYDKLIFIDSDLLVLKNLDEFFVYPQISAVENCRHIFNSGVMLVEPSKCTFETLMKQRFSVVSYNGGDQGFLNEIFRWWHRWPTKVNFLKDFYNVTVGPKHEYPANTYAIHYLGMKPWMCYQDYDCNWDIQDYQRFASDSAHARWWQVYQAMPKKLRSYCALTPKMENSLRKNKQIAKKGNFSDGHWKLKVKDPRKHPI